MNLEYQHWQRGLGGAFGRLRCGGMPPDSPAPRLILASRSPRRALLLREAGYAFDQADPPFDDPPQPEATHRDPAALALELARCKAASLAGARPPGGVILAADTICVGPRDELIGQPATRADAAAMLRGFLGVWHEVVTAVALLGDGDAEPTGFADTARVRLEHPGEAAMNHYLDSGQWRGKAGGYNLFDRQDDGWPIRVEGDPTTVVGLPMRRLRSALALRGVRPRRETESDHEHQGGCAGSSLER